MVRNPDGLNTPFLSGVGAGQHHLCCAFQPHIAQGCTDFHYVGLRLIGFEDRFINHTLYDFGGPICTLRAVVIIIYLLAFTGGFVIMSLELLGGRVLAPYFGSSIYVWGSIITVFMLSLSLGYLIGGRWSVRNPSLLRFGSIFIVGALLMYPLVLLAEPAMQWIFNAIEDPRYGSLVASALLFMVPTVILGMISPYSVRLLVVSVEHSGQIAGRLYFVSTLGSSLGTLATSFYFVLHFEINTILIMLTLALVVMFGVACTCHRLGLDGDQR